MIYKYTAENFYSIDKPVEVSFMVNEKAPESKGYFRDSNNIRVTKILAVLGANASGKTNVLKVLPFLKWLLTESFQDTKKGIPFRSYIGSSASRITKLKVSFGFDGNIYDYEVHLTKEKIYFENFRVFGKRSNRYRSLFKRSRTSDGRYKYVSSKEFNLSPIFEKVIRDDATVISTGLSIKHKFSEKIYKFWDDVVTNVNEIGFAGDLSLEDILDMTDFYYHNPEIFAEALKIMKKFDLGIEDAIIDPIKKTNVKTGQEVELFYPFFKHRLGIENYKIPIQSESTGTQSLFFILGLILRAIKHKAILILDEFSNNLHPMMLVELTDLFLDGNLNPDNAQLLITTHQAEVLNKLDKYQLLLVEKRINGATDAWRLDEIADIRPIDNLYAKYLAGVYGGTPNIN